MIVTCGHPNFKHYRRGMCSRCYSECRKSGQTVRYALKSKRDSTYMHRYGITELQVLMIKAVQNNACALCHADDKKLVVDHCHKTGRVRGLLCNGCNLFVSKFDNVKAVMCRVGPYLGWETIL